MEIILAIIAIVMVLAIAKTVFADKKTKTFRRIWTATWITNAASYDERNRAFDLLFEIYDMDFSNPPSLAAEKICRLLKDAAFFDAKYPNNRGVFILAEVGNELKARAKRRGNEAIGRAETGMKAFAGLIQAGML